jgi:hypothetical protein
LKAESVDRLVLRSARVTRALKPLARYAELSLVEQVVPIVFFALFFFSLVTAVT